MNFYKIVEAALKSKIFRRNIISKLPPILKRKTSFAQNFSNEGVKIWETEGYTCRVRSEGPDGPSGQEIPVVFGLEEFAQPLLVPVDRDHLVLDVLGET
jgi:hypothetical protein